MKLSITRVTLLFILFIGSLTILIQFYNREEYTLINDFNLNKYQYDKEFVLQINDSIYQKENKNEYDKIIHGLLNTHKNYDVKFQKDIKLVSLTSPFLKVELFYALNGSLIFKNINITTTNKYYCED